MKNKTIIDLFCAGAALLLAGGCTVNDPIYDSAHPGKAKVTLTTEWPAPPPSGIDIPTDYTVVAGDYSATLSGVTNTLDRLFEPGPCRFYVYNTPEHVSVSGATISVAGASGHPADQGPFVQEPGWLFTSAVDAAIKADTDHELTAVMRQQVRELTILLEFSGSSANRIERIEGYLSGVASTLNMDNGTHGGPLNAALTFTKVADGPDAGKWSAAVRLLGVAGDRQTLHTTASFMNDDPTPLTEDDDLSGALKNFNADKTTPLTVGSGTQVPSGIRDAGDLVRFSADWDAAHGDEEAEAGLIALWSRERTPDGTIYLEADIDMTDVAGFIPIGAYGGFTGTFDGGGYTISGLRIDSAEDNAGLFAINAGTIRNVDLENCTVETTGSAVGGLAGVNRGTVLNCHVTNCHITGGTGSTKLNAGGIVGRNYTGCRIENCTVTGGSVQARSNAGGIAGQVNAASVITGCRVTGGCQITATENSSGGIAASLSHDGKSDQARIIDCHVDGIYVDAYERAGGIAGENSRSVIENCTVTENTVVMAADQYSGGIAGYNSYSTILNSAITGGRVTAGSKYAGGIVSQNSKSTIAGCSVTDCRVFITGDSESGSYCGGIAGDNAGGTISGSWVTGAIVTAAANYLGGITGYNPSQGKVEGCVVMNARIEGSGENDVERVGGIVGWNSGSTVSGCAFIGGTLRATDYVGGIVAYQNLTSTVTGCIAAPEEIDATAASPVKAMIAGQLSGGSVSYSYGLSIGLKIASDTSKAKYCKLFQASEVTSAGNFFTKGSPTPIESMNDALSTAGVKVRWKAGDASSNWYPLPEVYE